MNITIDKENMCAYIYPSDETEKNAELMKNPDDNYRFPIYHDDDGRLYVDMPNYKDHHENLFTTRIGDAFDYVKSGEIDIIFISQGFSLLGGAISAFHYIDREYGETVRKNTLEKIKNLEIEYGIVAYNTCSFSGPSFIGKKSDSELPFYAFNFHDVARFSTEDEAKSFIENIMKNVSVLKTLMNEYKEMRKNKPYDDQDCVALLNKIKLYGPISINLARNDTREQKDGKFILEIRQIIKE